MLVSTDESPPWTFDGASFPAGSWTLEARALDWRGNIGASPQVTIHVGEAPDPGTTETDEGGDTAGTGTGDGPMLDEGGDSACSCSTEDSHPSATLLVLGLLVFLPRPAGRASPSPRR